VDAPVRNAAIRVAVRRLQSARFWRVIWLVLVGLTAFANGVGLALGTIRLSPVHWNVDDLASLAFIFAVFVGIPVAVCYASLRAKHRLQMLGQPQIQPSFGTATSSAPPGR